MTWSELTNLLGVVLPSGLAVAGYFAYRKGISKDANDARKDLIDALKEELSLTRNQRESLEKENARKDRILATIRHALKQKRIKLEIAGEYITLADRGKSQTTPILDRVVEDDDTDT